MVKTTSSMVLREDKLDNKYRLVAQKTSAVPEELVRGLIPRGAAPKGYVSKESEQDSQICSTPMGSIMFRSLQEENHLMKTSTMREHRRKRHRNRAKYVQESSSNIWLVQKHAAGRSINKRTFNPHAAKTSTPEFGGSLGGVRRHKISLEGPKLVEDAKPPNEKRVQNSACR